MFKPIFFVLLFSFVNAVVSLLFMRYVLQSAGSAMGSMLDGIGIVIGGLGAAIMLSLYWVPALLILSALINFVINLFKKDAVYAHTFNLIVYPLVLFLIISSVQMLLVGLGACYTVCTSCTT